MNIRRSSRITVPRTVLLDGPRFEVSCCREKCYHPAPLTYYDPAMSSKSRRTLEIEAKSAILNCLLENGSGTSAIVSELALNKWEYRADLVICGSSLAGFEIKTKADRLHRLLPQLEAYSKVFQQVYAVVAQNHLKKTLEIAPDHVGVFELIQDGSSSALRRIRAARISPNRDKISMFRLQPIRDLRIFAREIGLPRCSALPRSELETSLSALSLRSACKATREFLSRRFGEATRQFFSSTQARPIVPEDLQLLRVWPSRSPATTRNPATDELFFQWARQNHMFPLECVPQDVLDDLDVPEVNRAKVHR